MAKKLKFDSSTVIIADRCCFFLSFSAMYNFLFFSHTTDTDRFLTYSYVCVDQENWNNNNEFENISSTYIKFLNILPNDNNVNYDKEDIRVISKWKYAKLGITKQGITLFSSSYEMNNYTVLPKEFGTIEKVLDIPS